MPVVHATHMCGCDTIDDRRRAALVVSATITCMQCVLRALLSLAGPGVRRHSFYFFLCVIRAVRARERLSPAALITAIKTRRPEEPIASEGAIGRCV